MGRLMITTEPMQNEDGSIDFLEQHDREEDLCAERYSEREELGYVPIQNNRKGQGTWYAQTHREQDRENCMDEIDRQGQTRMNYDLVLEAPKM